MRIEAGVDSVPVPGGRLAFEMLAGGSEPILCIHGISSQRKLWGWLRSEDPDLTLLAPDLRGRGDSFGVAGPSSVARHALDMVAVLDGAGLRSVHICGMSMGAFVAVELAVNHRDRVKSLVLVDGGFPMESPAGLDRDSIRQAFADRFGRLERRWESLAEYKAYFVANTAPLLDPGDPILDAYLAHDLRDGRVRLSADAVASDAVDVFFGEASWKRLDVPVQFLHAEWSIGAGSAPAYPEELLVEYRPRTTATTAIPGVDHAGSIMTPAGAVATARAIHRTLGRP